MSEQKTFGRLLAKSVSKAWNGPPLPSMTLPGHLRDAHSAALAILDHTLDDQLQALGLGDAYAERLRSLTAVAAAVHDLGKANDQFQGMIHCPGPNATRQALRHEWITTVVLDREEWKEWLKPALAESDDWNLLRWAVSGHHPRYDRSAPPELADGDRKMTVLLGHDDIAAVSKWLTETFGLGQPPTTEDLPLDLGFGDRNPVDALHELHYDAEDAFDEFDDHDRRLLAAVKHTLIAADVAASALPRTKGRIGDWIEDTLGQKMRPAGKAYRFFAASRLGCGADELDAKLAERDFQRQVAASDADVTLAEAACGAGKTVAGYAWAANRCDGRRLFFCYPTTGTATQGFQDYLMDPKLVAVIDEAVHTNLIHGRREVDFQRLAAAEDRNEAVARLNSLETWRTPVVACTVDTVLGVIQNNRRGMFSWPALAQAGFVFDEIHSYNEKLFDALLHFLTHLPGVPVLLMTATLQASRKEAIADLLERQGRTLESIGGPEDIEQHPRYLQEQSIEKKVDARIAEELQDDGRVLVVCNTVRRALEMAERLKDHAPLVYHSRFKYRDRVEQHHRVVEAFNQTGKPALAICTQVAEMSLDLSATLLVTERCPVPSLVQRLGRLNRKDIATGDPKPEPVRPFVVLDPLGGDGKFSLLPYDAAELEKTTDWLKSLGDDALSQRELAEAWQALDDARPVNRWQSAWLDFGPATPVLELREGSPSVTVVLASDVEEHGLDEHADRLAAFALPMPLPNPKWDWQAKTDRGSLRTVSGVPVAKDEAIDYDPKRGASWQGK